MIDASGLEPFFRVAGTFDAPEPRLGDALRTRVRALSGFQKEALVTSARTGLTWRLVSDEGPYLNGHDAAPCPLAFFTVGMAASYLAELTALARIRGVPIGRARLVQDNLYTMKGSMRDRTMTGGALPVEVTVEVDAEMPDAALPGLVADALTASPVHGLLRERLQNKFTLARNGERISTGRATQLDGPILADPAPAFAGVSSKNSDMSLVAKIGATPRKELSGATSKAGSSLTDSQDRILDIGADACVRVDGLTEIVQLQYSPHGTSFRFLSEEVGLNEKTARAPDAATLLSAGLGFCFMTQFGRLVSMLGLDLPSYAIVQDTHFGLGGGTGATGKPGRADPIETHVHLVTSEDEATAREMLDISEQTCFLHALCRTDLKPKLSIRRA